jgi:hypothetical protein
LLNPEGNAAAILLLTGEKASKAACVVGQSYKIVGEVGLSCATEAAA